MKDVANQLIFVNYVSILILGHQLDFYFDAVKFNQ